MRAASLEVALVVVLSAPLASAAESDGAATKDSVAAEEKPHRALELAAAFGTTVALGDPAYPDQQLSFSRVGFVGRLTAAYRADYPILPYLALERARLARGATEPPGEAVFDQRLSATSLLPGAFFELEPVRLHLGLGFTSSSLELTQDGVTERASQLSFSAEVGLSVTVVDTRWLCTAIDVRYLDAGGADLRYFSLGLTLRGNVWPLPH